MVVVKACCSHRKLSSAGGTETTNNLREKKEERTHFVVVVSLTETHERSKCDHLVFLLKRPIDHQNQNKQDKHSTIQGIKKVTNDMTEVTAKLLDVKKPVVTIYGATIRKQPLPFSSREITKDKAADDPLGCCGPAARAALAVVSTAASSRSASCTTSKDVQKAITHVQESDGE